jgi:signal transduction histidine kinase
MASLRFKFSTFTLHTKTTILVSVVSIAVFAVIAYFSYISMTDLNEKDEEERAQLLATRVADTVELYIKTVEIQKGNRTKSEQPETIIADWRPVRDTLEATVLKTHSELIATRIFYKSSIGNWEERITIPADLPPATDDEKHFALRQPDDSVISAISEPGRTRHITAESSIDVLGATGLVQVGAVRLVLAFDESKTAVATLRGFIFPLMVLAIIAITLTTYFLFRQLVYEPLDKLLLTMAKAEAGDLSVESPLASQDEIGLLTRKFNQMLGRIRGMNEQLNEEQRRLEERVREATTEIAERNEQLEEANLHLFGMQRELTRLERFAVAGQLTAQFAHEVGTPLNLISGHVQLLRARASDERVIKRLDIISSQIERITSIVRSMLDSTRRPKPRLEILNINLLLEQILDATQPTLISQNVETITKLSTTELSVNADAEQLHQVFINLINNSLDAMPGGGRLLVTTAKEGDRVLIIVEDSGKGIAAEDLEAIFEPMFTTKLESGGTGLGLTIVRQIIQEHNGDIRVESEPYKGTRFLIRLPLIAL